MRHITRAFAAASMVLPMALPAPAMAWDRDGYYHGKTWRGHDGRLRCKKSNGTTGLIVGGAAGALAGRAIDTRGARAPGPTPGTRTSGLLGESVDGRVCRGGRRFLKKKKKN